MKKLMVLFISVLMLLFVTPGITAEHFVTCDPYEPEIGVTSFEVTLNGTQYSSPAVEKEGSIVLWFDLGTWWIPGSNTITAKAVNSWGISEASIPLVFTAAVPNAPANKSLVSEP